MADRWTLKNVLRQVRGARNAAARTAVRYAKDDVVALLARSAVAKLNAAESALKQALVHARRRSEPKRRAAA